MVVIAKVIKKASDFVDKIGCGLLILTMAGMVFFSSIQIIARVFFTALAWSEELTRYLLVWSTFIGAGCVYKRGGHINVSFVQDKFKGKANKYAKILVHLICIAFFIIAVYYGVIYMMKQGAQSSPALGIRMNLMYMAIPLGCGVMLLHALNAIFEILVTGEVAE
ncbi:MAG TPA: TRAP transporter small permease [Sedimentibacter sp.]|nr:TRAP transporter small permease [Sedimentibacter sp.]HPB79217.1 TRAP transporter small permease [Sedimentibacter sp.]HQC71020.1 TRAP transporter small permease [Sedimentibacter sp.]HQO72654.1 TRAP transporter small permease [Sedimentibacter sp.]HQO94830.1 TRAP transporter small permease [Sedimentibacter sp.]